MFLQFLQQTFFIKRFKMDPSHQLLVSQLMFWNYVFVRIIFNNFESIDCHSCTAWITITSRYSVIFIFAHLFLCTYSFENNVHISIIYQKENLCIVLNTNMIFRYHLFITSMPDVAAYITKDIKKLYLSLSILISLHVLSIKPTTCCASTL